MVEQVMIILKLLDDIISKLVFIKYFMKFN
jgi:hypothetical protein